MTTTDDLLKRARAHLVLCGMCDAGVLGGCTCPPGDPRSVIQDLVAEVEELHAALSKVADERCGCLPGLVAG